MDQDIRDALADIKGSVSDGFRDTNARIDKLVTQGEFKATVERLDAQHSTLRRDHDTLSASAVKEHAGIRAEWGAEIGEFRSSTRWAVGIAVTIAGLVFGIISWAIQTF